jgi:hypothetical protein
LSLIEQELLQDTFKEERRKKNGCLKEPSAIVQQKAAETCRNPACSSSNVAHQTCRGSLNVAHQRTWFIKTRKDTIKEERRKEDEEE